MTFLRLPLRVSPGGTLREVPVDDQEIGRRLKIFLLLGMGEYDHSPRQRFPRESPIAIGDKTASKDDPAVRRVRSLGIRALWEDLNRMGSSSRFHFLYNQKLLTELQNAITDQANRWFDGAATVLSTSVLGNEATQNAVIFETRSMRYTFELSFALPGTSRAAAFGSWKITETFDAKLRS